MAQTAQVVQIVVPGVAETTGMMDVGIVVMGATEVVAVVEIQQLLVGLTTIAAIALVVATMVVEAILQPIGEILMGRSKVRTATVGGLIGCPQNKGSSGVQTSVGKLGGSWTA